MNRRTDNRHIAKTVMARAHPSLYSEPKKVEIQSCNLTIEMHYMI